MDDDDILNLATKLAALEFLLEGLYMAHFQTTHDPIKAAQAFAEGIIAGEPKEFSVSQEATMQITAHLTDFVDRVTARLGREEK